jgi:hypothetical protein
MKQRRGARFVGLDGLKQRHGNCLQQSLRRRCGRLGVAKFRSQQPLARERRHGVGEVPQSGAIRGAVEIVEHVVAKTPAERRRVKPD